MIEEKFDLVWKDEKSGIEVTEGPYTARVAHGRAELLRAVGHKVETKPAKEDKKRGRR